MKIVAAIANIAQLGIIFAIFFIRGLDLGALVIFLLFILMSVPLINFLAFIFADRPMFTSTSSDIQDNQMIKRMAMRVRYPKALRPVFETAGTKFTVIDISEGGVRIRASRSTRFKKKVHAEIQMISGALIRFKASVMRRDETEVVFQFADPIGTALLTEEDNAIEAANAP